MKHRRLGFLGTILVLVVGCSKQPPGFEAWIRSPEATTRMELLAKSPEDFASADRAVLQEVVGDGKLPPLAAIERFFRSIPASKVVGSESESGTTAKELLTYVAAGKRFKQNPSHKRVLSELWAMQVFRSLPLEKRIELLKRPLMRQLADPSKQGELILIEQSPTIALDNRISGELSFLFPPSSESMMRFRGAIDGPL
jgi:hypothetical protein